MLSADNSCVTTAWKFAASRQERTTCASAGLTAVKKVTSCMMDRASPVTISSRDRLMEVGKDDDPCAGLQRVLHLRLHLLADVRLRIVDDDHRAVRQV